MQVFDASSIIYAWDNYPPEQFPGLWDWIELQIREKNLVMATVAFEEVEKKTPECADWLKDNDLFLVKINNTIVRDAMRIKTLLGILDDIKFTMVEMPLEPTAAFEAIKDLDKNAKETATRVKAAICDSPLFIFGKPEITRI